MFRDFGLIGFRLANLVYLILLSISSFGAYARAECIQSVKYFIQAFSCFICSSTPDSSKKGGFSLITTLLKDLKEILKVKSLWMLQWLMAFKSRISSKKHMLLPRECKEDSDVITEQQRIIRELDGEQGVLVEQQRIVDIEGLETLAVQQWIIRKSNERQNIPTAQQRIIGELEKRQDILAGQRKIVGELKEKQNIPIVQQRIIKKNFYKTVKNLKRMNRDVFSGDSDYGGHHCMIVRQLEF
jgi:hypothetical protein